MSENTRDAVFATRQTQQQYKHKLAGARVGTSEPAHTPLNIQSTADHQGFTIGLTAYIHMHPQGMTYLGRNVTR